MKIKRSLLAGILVLASTQIIGAPAPYEQPETETEEPAEFRNITPKEVLEIGNRKDVSRIAELRRIRAYGLKTLDPRSENAHVALAKLGEKKEMDEILAETKSENSARKYQGIVKLGQVGNKQAIARLIELLDDRVAKTEMMKGRDGKLRHSDVQYGAPAISAIQALKKNFPDGPGYKKKFKFPTDDDVLPWKNWMKSRNN